MFSIITIASSTTNPVEIVNAISDRLSRLKPISFITPKVPTTASGNATLGITVAQNFLQKHKNHHHNQADRQEQRELHIANRSADRCGPIRQRIVTFTEGGMEARSRGSKAFTRSAVWMMLAPGWRWISRMTAGFSPTQPGKPHIFDVVDHLAQIAQAHRRTVSIRDNHISRNPGLIESDRWPQWRRTGEGHQKNPSAR